MGVGDSSREVEVGEAHYRGGRASGRSCGSRVSSDVLEARFWMMVKVCFMLAGRVPSTAKTGWVLSDYTIKSLNAGCGRPVLISIELLN